MPEHRNNLWAWTAETVSFKIKMVGLVDTSGCQSDESYSRGTGLVTSGVCIK